jgi:hypothetical protein
MSAADDRRVFDTPLCGRSWEEIARSFDIPLRGVREVTELRQALHRLEREFVIAARRNHSTWAEIGDALGISRQAAYARHRPFVKRTDGDCPRPAD